MISARFRLLGVLGALALGGCTGVEYGDSGSGGAGGTSADTSASSTSTDDTSTSQGTPAASTTASGSSSSAGSECDTGEPGASPSPVCQACSDCAAARGCADEIAAFNSAPGASEWSVCVYGDQSVEGCPADDPATPGNESQPCIDDCNAAWPDAAAAFVATIVCILCDFCPTNCDAPASCGL